MAVKVGIPSYPPPSPPVGGLAFTPATVVVPYGLQSQVVNIVDASINLASKIFVTWGLVVDQNENTPDMDDVEFHAQPKLGSMDLIISSVRDFVGGTYNIWYVVT